MLLEIRVHFTFKPRWYREGESRRLVLEYYVVLRAALIVRLHLRRCLTRCRHCRIFFLTHPRNCGRKDLGCPFGCRDSHRAARSDKRSSAYNSTPAGKLKKKSLNGRRRQAGNAAAGEKVEECGGGPDDVVFDAEIVEHVRVVTTLIEGFAVSREDVIEMLKRAVRQRSIARQRRIDYVLQWLAEHGP